VRLLETNQKEFVEYHWMSGWRAVSMISKLIWMRMNPNARPAAVDYPQVKAFVPPIER
jgi:hypothetical protein